MTMLYNVFNIMKCTASAYLGHGECRGARLPIGRRERWDTRKMLQSCVAVRGAGMKLLELVILLRQ